MNTFASENGDGKDFVSHAPGYWGDAAPDLWNDWKWQLKNRVTTLAQLEKHLELSAEERSGVLLSGDKLALAVTLERLEMAAQKQAYYPRATGETFETECGGAQRRFALR